MGNMLILKDGFKKKGGVLKTALIFFVVILLFSVFIVSCDPGVDKDSADTGEKETIEGSFGIYLPGEEEALLTESHIKAFHSQDNSLELNEAGIERWNSYLGNNQEPPKLADSLHARDFILKIDDEEICRGKFWSYLSSAAYRGIVISGILFEMNEDNNNTLKIETMFIDKSEVSFEEIQAELVRFFEKNKLIK